MGGAEQMLYKLVTRMDQNRFRCLVVSMTDKGTVGDKIASAGIPVFELGMALGRPGLGGAFKLVRFLKRERVDLVQSWLYHADLLGLIAGRLAGTERVVWGIRCSDMHLKNYRALTALTVRLGAWLSPWADAIVVNSSQGKDVHEQLGYCTERMALIPNGFESDRFVPDSTSRQRLLEELGLRQETVLVGLVARFDPMKDHKTFLKAAALLAENEGSVHFVMIGKGLEDKNPDILPLLEDHRLKGRVHLLGLRDDIPELVSALDIAASSSAYGEGFSNTIGEAMLCGVPCVVTDVGDSARIVGDSGIIVPPGDLKVLAEALERLVRMGRDGRNALGERARTRIMEHYEIGKIVGRFEAFYLDLLAGKS